MKNYQNYLSEIFHFSMVKFSVYLNRRVFVMNFQILVYVPGSCRTSTKQSCRIRWVMGPPSKMMSYFFVAYKNDFSRLTPLYLLDICSFQTMFKRHLGKGASLFDALQANSTAYGMTWGQKRLLSEIPWVTVVS